MTDLIRLFFFSSRRVTTVNCEGTERNVLFLINYYTFIYINVDPVLDIRQNVQKEDCNILYSKSIINYIGVVLQLLTYYRGNTDVTMNKSGVYTTKSEK